MNFDKVVEGSAVTIHSRGLESLKRQNLISYLKELVNHQSITPCDAGLIEMLAADLNSLGFEVDTFERNQVKNLIAKRHFGVGPTLAFSGHVDVVPARLEAWHTNPFEASIQGGIIYGRGTTDMKGGIAAMMSATRALISSRDDLSGTFYWLLTSDEEGEAECGSKLIAERLKNDGIVLDACLIGEPTSNHRVGDTIRNGRRGSISGSIQFTGKAGHVAYPEQTINSAHVAGQLIPRLLTITWEKEPINTNLQITGINTSTNLDNIVPDLCVVNFNIRYSHLYSSQEVIDKVKGVLSVDEKAFNLTWSRACEPYSTPKRSDNCFLNLMEESIFENIDRFPLINTIGGTSDGRFFANGHTQVVECGVRNNSIHQANEHVSIDDLIKIEQIYSSVLSKFFGKNDSSNCKNNQRSVE
ncbi:succinyl-diaminopimelate desuccinylase [Alteromonas portus]|uniref:succinyl-diaminopimelate desuccinylase n=1 Tax=Alteromonas portus TaxID=2565549 RepID=UPI003BF8DFFF